MISSISGLVNMTPQKQVAYNASKGGLTMAAKVSTLLHALCSLANRAESGGRMGRIRHFCQLHFTRVSVFIGSTSSADSQIRRY